ncbi:hypothetical protein BG011_002346 [Mortierella polycephala]|uniref:Uncharacterized protein n=1 Tax=Mortierella polycephala TaxID=41804 RepID=A0A9P6U4V1_9FUNG|nr:hypothetical protein BG011_002346 [Mortierella polycephala]
MLNNHSPPHLPKQSLDEQQSELHWRYLSATEPYSSEGDEQAVEQLQVNAAPETPRGTGPVRGASIRSSASQSNAYRTIPTATLQSHVRKAASGAYKNQQNLLTAELHALKARVQELEMERMNRSLSNLTFQSQTAMPQDLDSPTFEEQQLYHRTDKARYNQRHRGSATSVESSSTSRSPVVATASMSRHNKPGLGFGVSASASSGAMTRLESSLGNASSSRNASMSASMSASPRLGSTQHVALLQDAFKTFDKTLSAVGGVNASPTIQAMSKVVTNTISMNRTIRTWVKADVSLVESSSMDSLQRTSDEQIRSLTESLLAIASNYNAMERAATHTDPRPYSPNSSSATSYDLGHRLSLGMAGGKMSGHQGSDPNPPYPTRPLSLVAPKKSTSTGSVASNFMTSSGYLTRNASIVSIENSEPGARASDSQGYNSDFSEDRFGSRHGAGRTQYQQREIISSRESSPPQQSTQGLTQRRQLSELSMHSSQSWRDSTRTPNSRQYPTVRSPVMETADNDELAQLARRQASVQRIMARYSQPSPVAPSFSRLDPDQELVTSQQRARAIETARATGDRHESPISTPMEFTPTGQSRISQGGRRPLSQQGYRTYSESRQVGLSSGQRGNVIQHPGRNGLDKGISEDEGNSVQWGTASLDQLPPRTMTKAFSTQSLRVHNRHQQALHLRPSDAESDPQNNVAPLYPSDTLDVSRVPSFARPKQSFQTQQQDMMMTTPTMPSTNSSPSSSSRLDAPSAVSSNDHPGGLTGVGARYHLSPRGTSNTPTFGRQKNRGL